MKIGNFAAKREKKLKFSDLSIEYMEASWQGV
jgi:hypothetical protein